MACEGAMELDPLVKAFLDRLAASPRPKVWDASPEETRAGFRAMMKTFGPKDVPIGKVENLTMPGPGGDLALRAYTPVAAGGESLPALVYFHGGSFRNGDLDSHENICRLLAGEIGCRVIAVDYRRSPEHKFPAAVDDAFAALRWIETNAAGFGVDPNRIAVGGDSAGGNLAAVACQMAKAQDGPHIAFQLLLFPLAQFGSTFASMREYAEGYMLETASLEYCSEAYAPREMWPDPRLSPLLAADVSGLPPAYVAVAGCDPLHDEGVAYADKLRAACVLVTLADYPGFIHQFTMFQAVLPQAREALVAAAKAVKAAFAAV
jgi:acetyl esterase